MKGYKELLCGKCGACDELHLEEKTNKVFCYDCLTAIYSCDECGYVNFINDKKCHKCGTKEEKG